MITIIENETKTHQLINLARGDIFKLDGKILMKSDELQNNCWNCMALSEPDIGYIMPISMNTTVTLMKVLSDATITFA